MDPTWCRRGGSDGHARGAGSREPTGAPAGPARRVTASMFGGGQPVNETQEVVVDEVPSSAATPHPVGVRRIRCDQATHVRLPAEAAGYTVAVPLNGAVEVTYRTGTLGADSGRAVVFRPETDIGMSCGEHFSCYAVTIDTSELQDVLERRPGHTVRRPPELAVSLDLRT